MADVNVLDLAEVTPSATSDDLILFDRTTGEAKAARYPTIGNATLTIQKNGTTVNSFTANATSNKTINITMTKGDVGLGNVGNFKAVSTVASQGLSTTEKANARTNIGAGTSSFSGAYSSLTGKPDFLYLTNVACSATTGDFVSVSNSAITANHVVAECTFSDPSSIKSDVTWTTASGSLKLNGICSTATTCNIVLIPKTN